ncbi:amidohydrolase family protein, partial [bacterium]|nr:amidohydrolase family protein [bacterium]
LIDAHSHLALRGGVNEATHSMTSETRIRDVIDSDDIDIYRQLAGGLTMSCIIHGSANTIGGQNAVIKLRWGALPDEMLVGTAKPGLKFALGENVKRSNVQGPPTTRYPATRMGVEQYLRDAFQAAKDYRQEWQVYERDKKEGKNPIPPRRDLRLEPLVEILDGKRQVQCHSYRQDEILALIRVGDDMGFKVEFLIHILEGYKVADVLKKHGTMPSTFSDWWAYKFEVYDAIPYNGALMRDQGLLVSFNSDDTELARRMNLEAAKAVKYGNVPEEEALKFVTLNPAIQLGVNDRAGSIEPGKDADFVIWSGSPLSTYSMCEQTWIDGRRYFDRAEDGELRKKAAEQKTAITQKILGKKPEKKQNTEKTSNPK